MSGIQSVDFEFTQGTETCRIRLRIAIPSSREQDFTPMEYSVAGEKKSAVRRVDQVAQHVVRMPWRRNRRDVAVSCLEATAVFQNPFDGTSTQPNLRPINTGAPRGGQTDRLFIG